MSEPFDPADTDAWIAHGRSPVQAAALADAWRRFPDLANDSPLDQRMARMRERVTALRPVMEAMAHMVEAEQVLPTRPDLCRYGNAGYNILDSPGQFNLDFGFFKNFPITERTRIQLRWELFNATNTPYFGDNMLKMAEWIRANGGGER